jgi:MFS transporter, UMF1 family
MIKFKFTKQEISWALYDVANSAFVLIIITTIFQIYFKDIASKGIDGSISTSNWGFANALASSIIAVLSPFMGAVGSLKNNKKRLFVFFLFFGILFTLLFTTINEGDWLKCLIIFMLARIGWSGANLFYDAFLVDVTKKERLDWLSSIGFGLGYIGSVIPFLLVITIIIPIQIMNKSKLIPIIPSKISFIIVVVWWFIFSIPMIKNVKQIYFVENNSHFLKDSFKRLFNTFLEIFKNKIILIFLLSYFFYIDGIHTIFSMATAYGRDIGLDQITLITAILFIQIIAFPFTLMFGKLAQKKSPKIMIFIGICIYSIITLIGFFLPSMPTINLKIIFFWILAFLVATSQGGIQALSRSLFSKIIPRERATEFFGFYNIFGKFSIILGPFILGIFTRITGHSKYGILSLLFFFTLGAILLLKVKE